MPFSSQFILLDALVPKFHVEPQGAPTDGHAGFGERV
jgi:hypothetical protein